MLRKLFASSVHRQILKRSFASNEEMWGRNFRIVIDEDETIPHKVASMKALLSNELSFGKHFPLVRDVLDQILQSQFPQIPEVRKDKQLMEGFQKFKEKCMKQDQGQALLTAMMLNSFVKDQNEKRKDAIFILKKFEAFITTAQLFVLSRNIDLLASFIGYSEEYEQSNIAQKIHYLVNQIYSEQKETFSLESQLRLLDIFTAETKDPKNAKNTEIVRNIAENLKEASFPELMFAIFHLSNRHGALFPEAKDQIEVATIHMLSYVISPNDLAKLFTSVALFAGDAFWEKVITMIANTFKVMDPIAKSEVMYICAVCRRGSDELWEKFFKIIVTDLPNMEKSAQLKVFFSNKHIGYDNVPEEVEKLSDEIFRPDFINALSFPDLIIMVENCLVFEEIPAEKRELVIDFARKLAKSGNPQIKHILESLFDNYKR